MPCAYFIENEDDEELDESDDHDYSKVNIYRDSGVKQWKHWQKMHKVNSTLETLAIISTNLIMEDVFN